ncbi:rCG57322, partial [Rattus norvegicus]
MTACRFLSCTTECFRGCLIWKRGEDWTVTLLS